MQIFLSKYFCSFIIFENKLIIVSISYFSVGLGCLSQYSIQVATQSKEKQNETCAKWKPYIWHIDPMKNEIFLSPPFEINRVDPTKFWKSKNIFVDLYYFYTQKISHQLFSQKFFIPWIWTQLSLMVGLRFLKFFDWEEEVG